MSLEWDQGECWLECNSCDSTYGIDYGEYDDVQELESDASNDGWFVDIEYKNGPNPYRADFCCEQCQRDFDYEYYDDD